MFSQQQRGLGKTWGAACDVAETDRTSSYWGGTDPQGGRQHRADRRALLLEGTHGKVQHVSRLFIQFVLFVVVFCVVHANWSLVFRMAKFSMSVDYSFLSVWLSALIIRFLQSKLQNVSQLFVLFGVVTHANWLFVFMHIIFACSTADMCSIWQDCAFYDKSMKFSRQLQYAPKEDFWTSHICPNPGQKWWPFYKMAASNFCEYHNSKHQSIIRSEWLSVLGAIQVLRNVFVLEISPSHPLVTQITLGCTSSYRRNSLNRTPPPPP